MKKPTVVNIGSSKKPKKETVNEIIKPDVDTEKSKIASDALSYLQRRKTSSTKSKTSKKEKNKSKQSFFTTFNSKLNELSTIQFALILILVVVLTFTGFQISVGKMKNPIETITNIIPESITNKIDCDTDVLNPICWPNKIVPSLEKTDGFTNALLIGLDTRDGESGLMNTDTIMVASYDHSNGKTLLISFPRDLHVPYSVNEKQTGYKAKINSIYAMGENRKDTDGMEMLTENIENWLDLEIHYKAKVNFNTVTDIVDAVGGVTITVDEKYAKYGKYTDIYPYKELSKEKQQNCKRASDKPLYCVFEYEIGDHEFNGEEALIYARMRQYTSDFDRARRQQEVISAVKTKILGGEGSVLEKASFGWNIYQTLLDEKNIDANIENNDLIAGALLLTKSDPNPKRVILDPTFGGGGFMSEGRVGQDEEGNGGIYVISIKDQTFGQIRYELERVREFPDLYEDNASVVISNSTGTKLEADSKAIQLKEINPYFDFLVYNNGKVRQEEETIKIYVFNHDKQVSVNYLKEFFGISALEYVNVNSTENQTGHKEDIKVVISNPLTIVDETNEETE